MALLLYAPALDGPFLSDDWPVLQDPALQSLEWENLAEILDPRGGPAARTANYAPLHLLAHALEIRWFGAETRGYHVVNVLIHALNALLLMLLLRTGPLPWSLAALGGAFFLVHPANVEAVAWIFQLKTQLAFALAASALLLREGRPALAALLFAAALLCKISAVAVLPVAAALAWSRGRRAHRDWAWLGVWLVLALAVAVPELAAFRHAGEFRAADAAPLGQRLPFVVEIAARYAVLGLTSLGASSFHEPEPPESWLEPWPLAGLALLSVVALRTLRALAGRRPEAAWWLWCAAGFLPVSQLFAFRFPMADRYLYFMLPGLIGALLLAAEPWLRGGRRLPLAALAALALLGLSAHTTQRAAVWSSGEALVRDAASHYPGGVQAQLLRATERARGGDPEGALAALEAAAAGGFGDFETLRSDPSFRALHGRPRFEALTARMADAWIARTEARPSLGSADLRRLGRVHAGRGDHARALDAFERALAIAPAEEEAEIRVELLRARGALERGRGQ